MCLSHHENIFFFQFPWLTGRKLSRIACRSTFFCFVHMVGTLKPHAPDPSSIQKQKQKHFFVPSLFFPFPHTASHTEEIESYTEQRKEVKKFFFLFWKNFANQRATQRRTAKFQSANLSRKWTARAKHRTVSREFCRGRGILLFPSGPEPRREKKKFFFGLKTNKSSCVRGGVSCVGSRDATGGFNCTAQACATPNRTRWGPVRPPYVLALHRFSTFFTFCEKKKKILCACDVTSALVFVCALCTSKRKIFLFCCARERAGGRAERG